MPTYTTAAHVINFTTRKPFQFEISKDDMRYLHEGSPLNDFFFFPSYEKVREIFFEDGYTTELATAILTDFGTPVDKIAELLISQKFVSSIRGYFSNITCDGERAARTLMHVYNAAKGPVLTIDVQDSPLRIGS